jgi:hypothetical protein
MKLLFCGIATLLFVCSIQAQSAGTLTDINGNTLHLDSLHSKKCLVIILPVQTDTSAVNQVLRFKNRFVDSVQVIGMVCCSACNTSLTTIHNLYDVLVNADVFITTAAMAGTAASDKEVIIKWISDRNNNRAAEPGIVLSKYFISPGGHLYAQPGATIKLDAPVIFNLARTKVPGEQ